MRTSFLMWVMDALKGKKVNDKIFHCNDVAQIIIEICGISRKQIFNKRELAPVLSRRRNSIYLDEFEQRSLSSLILNSLQNIATTQDMILEDANNYRTFQLRVRSNCVNG